MALEATVSIIRLSGSNCPSGQGEFSQDLARERSGDRRKERRKGEKAEQDTSLLQAVTADSQVSEEGAPCD